jgi:hypothetical protein
LRHISVVDPGFMVDPVDSRTRDQPQDPDQPRLPENPSVWRDASDVL